MRSGRKKCGAARTLPSGATARKSARDRASAHESTRRSCVASPFRGSRDTRATSLDRRAVTTLLGMWPGEHDGNHRTHPAEKPRQHRLRTRPTRMNHTSPTPRTRTSSYRRRELRRLVSWKFRVAGGASAVACRAHRGRFFRTWRGAGSTLDIVAASRYHRSKTESKGVSGSVVGGTSRCSPFRVGGVLFPSRSIAAARESKDGHRKTPTYSAVTAAASARVDEPRRLDERGGAARRLQRRNRPPRASSPEAIVSPAPCPGFEKSALALDWASYWTSIARLT